MESSNSSKENSPNTSQQSQVLKNTVQNGKLGNVTYEVHDPCTFASTDGEITVSTMVKVDMSSLGKNELHSPAADNDFFRVAKPFNPATVADGAGSPEPLEESGSTVMSESELLEAFPDIFDEKNPSSSDCEEQGRLYVAGYVCHSYRHEFPNLGRITSALPSLSIPPWLNMVSRGGLVVPSREVMACFDKFEAEFDLMNGDGLNRDNGVFKKTIKRFENCQTFLPKKIITKFARTRLFVRQRFLNHKGRSTLAICRQYFNYISSI